MIARLVSVLLLGLSWAALSGCEPQDTPPGQREPGGPAGQPGGAQRDPGQGSPNTPAQRTPPPSQQDPIDRPAAPPPADDPAPGAPPGN